MIERETFVLKIQNGNIDPLIRIIEWNIVAYCDPNDKKDEFKTRLNPIKVALEKASGADDVELKEDAVRWIKDAVENAWNYQQECGVSKETVGELYRWILSIYKNW